MDANPTTPDQYRATVGQMLTAIHPLYDAAKGTAEQDQYVDLLENARRQLEAVYAEIPASGDTVPDYVTTLFAGAQAAYQKAINAPRTTGFTAAKSFGQQAVSQLESFATSANQGIKAAIGLDLGIKVVGGLLALVVIGGIVYFATRKK